MAFRRVSADDSKRLELIKRFAALDARFPQTSYSSDGNQPVTTDLFNESGSQRESKYPDVVPILQNRTQAIRTYDQMVNNDATVDISLRAAKISITGATFYIEPGSDRQDDLDIAEFCCYNTIDSPNQPFSATRENILRMFEYGISCFEPVYERGFWAPKRDGANAKNYVMLKKLGYRPAATITKFLYDDNGGPAGIEQMAVRADGRTEKISLGIDKLILFAFDSNGGPFDGRSLLRKAYKPWFYKDYLYKIDAIQKERHSLGVPKVTLQQGFTATDVANAWGLVRRLHANEQTGVVLPPEVLFDIEFGSGQPIDVMPSIEHHDARILLNTLTQFLMLGLMGTGGGGRATGATGADLLQKSNRYVADYICTIYNMFIIPKLVGYNFKVTNFPKMRVKRLGETKDLQMWASALANLAHQGLLTPDHGLESWTREELDAPIISEDARKAILAQQAAEAAKAAANNGFGGVKPGGNGKGSGDTSVPAGYEGTK